MCTSLFCEHRHTHGYILIRYTKIYTIYNIIIRYIYINYIIYPEKTMWQTEDKWHDSLDRLNV